MLDLNNQSPGELVTAVRALRARGFTQSDVGAALVFAGGILLAGSHSRKKIRQALRRAAAALPKQEAD